MKRADIVKGEEYAVKLGYRNVGRARVVDAEGRWWFPPTYYGTPETTAVEIDGEPHIIRGPARITLGGTGVLVRVLRPDTGEASTPTLNVVQTRDVLEPWAPYVEREERRRAEREATRKLQAEHAEVLRVKRGKVAQVLSELGQPMTLDSVREDALVTVDVARVSMDFDTLLTLIQRVRNSVQA